MMLRAIKDVQEGRDPPHIIRRQQDAVVGVDRRRSDLAVGCGVNVVTVYANERVALPGDVAVAVENVLTVLVVVVAVGLTHVLCGGR